MRVERCIFRHTGHLVRLISANRNEFTQRIFFAEILVRNMFGEYHSIRFQKGCLPIAGDELVAEEIKEIRVGVEDLLLCESLVPVLEYRRSPKVRNPRCLLYSRD